MLKLTEIILPVVQIVGFIWACLIIWKLSRFLYMRFPKIQRGFEALSSLNVPYYKGVTKEELGDWDTLEVSHRKLIH